MINYLMMPHLVVRNKIAIKIHSGICRASVIPEPMARSAVPGVSPGEGTNSPRLFTPGETNALAKSKVHQ
jgi:hypothetical protein